MAKLYFKYGSMGSSKTAQALITKFNYEERGMKVWLVKPETDTRDGKNILKSRVGLTAECTPIGYEEDVFSTFSEEHADAQVIIADECQFFSKKNIDGFRRIVDEKSVPVLCFGLRTDFLCRLFSGSMRLFEIADSISEIKTVCKCGKKATVNARIMNGRIVTEGESLMLGDNDKYEAMCHKCYTDRIKREKEVSE